MPGRRSTTPGGRGAILLAPAGSPEAARAAFAYGADAVYLGLKRFSARAEAANFTLEELEDTLALARQLRPRREVYVAVNTLVLDGELRELVETLAALDDLGVDAVMLQDWGAFGVARRFFPGLALHASTQMAAHSAAGAKALARAGFSRVILAREMTLEEIRLAARSAREAGAEVEVFIHGALCYSYSGLCLYSSFETGGSANRGRCAQLCRREFSPPRSPAGSGRLPFSMKDLALGPKVAELVSAGAAALKIEGRMKKPLYVAIATDYYRKLLDGRLAEREREALADDLRLVFSRPWTTLALDSRRAGDVADCDFTGHRGLRVGEVRSVRRAGERHLVAFVTSRAIEAHDGLQIEIPGRVRPFAFAVKGLRVASAGGRGEAREAFEAPAGASVEVELPGRGHPEIPEGAGVYLTSSQELQRRWTWPPAGRPARVRKPVEATVELGPDAVTARLALRHPSSPETVEATARVEGPFAPARDASATGEAVRRAFSKLGGSPFEPGRIEVRNPEGVFVPASVLTALRRDCVEALTREVVRLRRGRLDGILRELDACGVVERRQPPAEPSWSIKVDRVEYLDFLEEDDWRNTAEAVVELRADRAAETGDALRRLASRIGEERLRIALPVITRAWEEPALRKAVAALRGSGWSRWEISNPAGWEYLAAGPCAHGEAGGGLDVSADWPIYVTNRAAAEQVLSGGDVGRFTLSMEDGFENMRSLLGRFGARATVVVWCDAPLFASEWCPKANLSGGCRERSCPGEAELELAGDGAGEVLAVTRGCRTFVVGAAPFCIAGRLGELVRAGAERFRACFTRRSCTPERLRSVWRKVRSGEAPAGCTEANFARGLA